MLWEQQEWLDRYVKNSTPEETAALRTEQLPETGSQ